METAAPQPAEAAEATPAPSPRAGRRPRDMALSMLVLLVPVFLLVGFYRFLGHEEPPAVDTTEVYGSVQRANQFPLLQPEGLPEGWRIASATFTDGILRIGVTAPDDGNLQVVESAHPTAELVPGIIGKSARPAETVTVNGTSWQRYTEGRPGETALLQTTGTRTTIVVGRATDAQLQRLVATLK